MQRFPILFYSLHIFSFLKLMPLLILCNKLVCSMQFRVICMPPPNAKCLTAVVAIVATANAHVQNDQLRRRDVATNLHEVKYVRNMMQHYAKLLSDRSQNLSMLKNEV